MIRQVLAALILSATMHAQAFDEHAAERFAKLALACVHKEYPNKIAHVLNSDADVAPPRKLTPAFYGCYDWHSSVHGHWLLVRLLRTFPDAPFAADARAALQQSLTPENIRAEAAYLGREGNAAFERPYGLAWLIMLGAEFHEWDAQQTTAHKVNGKAEVLTPAFAHDAATTLEPLVAAVRARLMTWLPKLPNPIRIGEHNQTAFAFGLLLDSSRITGDREFQALLMRKAREFYLNDRDCPMPYEPSGEDFLSPCLAEADVMRRVLAPAEFAGWLRGFLPAIPANGSSAWLKPVVSPDPSDPKLAHLDGLNLSRAWMLDGIVAGLPKSDPRVAALQAALNAHRAAGLAAVTGERYEGAHWLGTFAVYLATRRGAETR